MARNKAGIETKERILRATRSLLGDKGLEETTIKAICSKAGIRAGSFYNLFPTKDEAILTVVREAINRVDPHPDGEGIETLDELVEAYRRFIMDEADLARIYLQLAVGTGLTDEHLATRIRKHHEHRVGRFRDALIRERPELPASDAQLRVEVLLAALSGLSHLWLGDRSFDFTAHTLLLMQQVRETVAR